MPTLDALPAAQPVNALSREATRALETLIGEHLGATFPALVLTVVLRGEVLVNAAWGWLDAETRQRPTPPDALFDLASLSKLFTATAFLRLASAERVALDTPLVEIVPEFGATGARPLNGGQDPHTHVMLPTPPEALGQTADPARVTFRHLLTHTSGLAPWRAVYEVAGPPPPPPDRPDPIPRAERWRRALDALCRYPFVGQPGDGVVRYSDLGLMLLGEAVARLDGASGALDAALATQVTEPLELASLTFNPLAHGRERTRIPPTELDTTWRKRRCWGEVHDENACGVGGVAGHAGLFGTARDVAALGQAWLSRDPRLGIAPPLMNEALREQARTGAVRRGLGWALKAAEDAQCGERFSAESFGHTGFTGTSLWCDPRRALVVAALTNRVYYGRRPEDIRAFRQALHTRIAEIVDGA